MFRVVEVGGAYEVYVECALNCNMEGLGTYGIMTNTPEGGSNVLERNDSVEMLFMFICKSMRRRQNKTARTPTLRGTAAWFTQSHLQNQALVPGTTNCTTPECATMILFDAIRSRVVAMGVQSYTPL